MLDKYPALRQNSLMGWNDRIGLLTSQCEQCGDYFHHFKDEVESPTNAFHRCEGEPHAETIREVINFWLKLEIRDRANDPYFKRKIRRAV